MSAAIISYNRPIRRPLPVAIVPSLVPLLSTIGANRFCPAYAQSAGIVSFVLLIAFWIVNGALNIQAERDQKLKEG